MLLLCLPPLRLNCKSVFVLCLLGGSYLFYRLTKAQEMDYAFRYAMPTVIVLWSCVELLVKWKITSEPWISLNPLFMGIVTVAFIVILLYIVRAERRKKAVWHKASRSLSVLNNFCNRLIFRWKKGESIGRISFSKFLPLLYLKTTC